MKTRYTVLALVVTLAILFSCKDKDVTTPTEERIEKNHPTEMDNTEYHEDSVEVVKDSVTDHNMKDQSDTHGRNVEAGK